MKNLVLGVFAFGASDLNANHNKMPCIYESEVDCFEVADQTATGLGIIYNLSYAEEFATFERLYKNCIKNNS